MQMDVQFGTSQVCQRRSDDDAALSSVMVLNLDTGTALGSSDLERTHTHTVGEWGESSYWSGSSSPKKNIYTGYIDPMLMAKDLIWNFLLHPRKSFKEEPRSITSSAAQFGRFRFTILNWKWFSIQIQKILWQKERLTCTECKSPPSSITQESTRSWSFICLGTLVRSGLIN